MGTDDVVCVDFWDVAGSYSDCVLGAKAEVLIFFLGNVSVHWGGRECRVPLVSR